MTAATQALQGAADAARSADQNDLIDTRQNRHPSQGCWTRPQRANQPVLRPSSISCAGFAIHGAVVNGDLVFKFGKQDRQGEPKTFDAGPRREEDQSAVSVFSTKLATVARSETSYIRQVEAMHRVRAQQSPGDVSLRISTFAIAQGRVAAQQPLNGFDGPGRR